MWSNSPTMKILRKLVTSSLLVLVLGLNACSGLTKSDTPAMKTWWLEPYTEMTPDKAADPVLLKVSVTVVPGLDTDRILILSDKAELTHYSGARWAENLPELLASLSKRSLESSGRFEIVSALARCDLDLEIQEFFADLSASGQTTGVRVAIKGRYKCGSVEAMSLYLDAATPVHDERVSAIVTAFQQALDSVMKDLLKQVH